MIQIVLLYVIQNNLHEHFCEAPTLKLPDYPFKQSFLTEMNGSPSKDDEFPTWKPGKVLGRKPCTFPRLA